MQRYFLYLSYDGTAYHGWQVQPGAISVQEVLQKSLSTILRRETEVVGAGRTDAGVHASLMVAHFDGEDNLDEPSWRLVDRLNRLLPQDVAVSRICRVCADAHARFSATARTYHYYICRRKSPFSRQYAWRYEGQLDMTRMNEAAACLSEYCDFTSFSKLHTDVKTNNCRIFRAFWEEREDGMWVFTIEADRFLRNMVRAVVGTLLDVGRGKLSVEEFRSVIEKQDRCAAGSSVAACGLFLTNVSYPEIIFL